MTRIPKSVKSTRQILQDDNDILHSIFCQSQSLLRIETVMRRYVDKKISVSSFENKQLVLITNNGANATNLRYRQRNLISALKQEGFEINEIKIKVQPEFQTATKRGLERELSPETARHLVSSAQSIEDMSLRQALINLSKRAR